MFAILSHILGLPKIKQNNTNVNLDIEIGSNGINVTTGLINKESCQQKALRILKIVYNIFITVILSWTVIFSLYGAIAIGNQYYFYRSAFQCIFTLHYVLLLIYFRSNHFSNVVQKSKKLNTIFDILSICSIVLSLLVTVGSVLETCLTSASTNVYSDLFHYIDSPSGKWGIIILLIFNTLYNYLTFFMTILIYCIIMVNHKTNIVNYKHTIDEYIKTSTKLSNKIGIMTKDFSILHDEFSETVERLNKFFSVLNIFGLIGLFITIKSMINGNFNFINIFNSILFLIVDYVYISITQKVRKIVSDVTTIATSPLFIHKILKTQENINVTIDNDPFTVEKIGKITEKCLIYNAIQNETLEWLVLYSTLTQEWETFKILGIEITDSTIIQKIVGIFVGFIIVQDLASLIQ